MSLNEHQDSSSSSEDESAPPLVADATVVRNNTAISVTDPNGKRNVTVTLATHQVMLSAAQYSFKGVDFNDPHSVSLQVKKVREFLKIQDAVVGPTSLKVVTKPFLKSILRGTVLKPAFSLLWDEASESYDRFLDLVNEEVGQLSSNTHVKSAIKLQSYLPPPRSNLRMAVIHYAGEINSLGKKQFDLVPHQALLSHRLTQFVPVNVQHLIESDLRNPSGCLSLDEYVAKLRAFASTIHPKIMPSASSQLSSNANANGKPRHATGSGSTPQGNPNKPHQNMNSGSVKSMQHSNKRQNLQNESSSQPQTQHNNAQIQRPQPNNQRSFASTRHPNGFGLPRPPPVNVNPPVARPFVPTIQTGDVSMSGTSKAVTSASPKPPQQLGR